MGMCSSGHAYSKINSMVSKIDRLIYDIQKNRKQMDLVNASIIPEMDDACDFMVRKLEALKDSLRSYSFE